jgi:hypothetical protein
LFDDPAPDAWRGLRCWDAAVLRAFPGQAHYMAVPVEVTLAALAGRHMRSELGVDALAEREQHDGLVPVGVCGRLVGISEREHRPPPIADATT